MDKIYIKGLSIYSYHGVNPEEKLEGQPFILDICLKADLTQAKEDDRIDSTVSYAAVRKTVQRVFTERSYDLIERAAKVICDAVLKEHPKVQEVCVKLKKPNAPMNAVFDYAAVEITEKRGNLCR